jgi:hypothetical protein
VWREPSSNEVTLLQSACVFSFHFISQILVGFRIQFYFSLLEKQITSPLSAARKKSKKKIKNRIVDMGTKIFGAKFQILSQKFGGFTG